MISVDPIYGGKSLELDASLPEWDEETLLRADEKKLRNIALPEEDFAQPIFDAHHTQKLEKIILLISTPRSGSTALCDYLYRTSGIIAHEYFQPFQYMPALANRWSCIENGRVVPSRYVNSLIKHRTSSSGVLGINLHGSHINIFECFRRHFDPAVPIYSLYLKRQDKVAQAVSYYIAANTKKWSSHFGGSQATPKYSFSGIKEKLTSIVNQEKRAELVLASAPEESQTIFYESLVSTGAEVPDFMRGVIRAGSLKIVSSQTRKQAGLLNTIFAERFVRDLLLRSE